MSAASGPPVRLVTRLLAEMQTSILASALRVFDGDIDRFGVYTLIVRQTLGEDGRGGVPISTYSLAASLTRPYETVRRHVAGLIGMGLCARTEQGITVRPGGIASPAIAALTVIAHDCFVRFVEDLQGLGVPMPPRRSTMPYTPGKGVRAAADVMLAAADSNRAIHDDWLGLALFSSVFAANMRGVTHDPVLARQSAAGGSVLSPEHWQPVSATRIARTLGLPISTVHRRIARLVESGRLAKLGRGLVVNQAWLNRPEAIAISTNTYQNIRLVLWRLAANGFPFDDPASAYTHARRELVVFA